MLKLSIFMIFFISLNCFAIQTPVNALQIQYKKSIAREKKTESDKIDLHSISQIPEVTYGYLDDIFNSFYKKITFNTSIIDSTFKDKLNCEFFSLSLIPSNKQGVQMELFSNLSNLSKQYLSNLSADHVLYNYINNFEQNDIRDKELSFGAGISFNTTAFSKIKFILSNHEMPGYGGSTALLGFETYF